MANVRSDPTIGTASGDGRDDGAVDSPTLVLRPRLALRMMGPALIAIGLADVAVGTGAAAIAAIVGVGLLTVWIPRVAVDEHELRVRGVRRTTTVPLAEIDEFRLRRVPFGPKHVVRRNYRFGRFCSTPLRLRVLEREITRAQITVIFWGGWPALARYLLSMPAVHAESRTRERLDRYG